jgi:hypothetical protein
MSSALNDFRISTSELKSASGVQFPMQGRDKWPPLQNSASTLQFTIS